MWHEENSLECGLEAGFIILLPHLQFLAIPSIPSLSQPPCSLDILPPDFSVPSTENFP
jgi:hypothetical protein